MTKFLNLILLMVLALNANAKAVHWISIFDTNDSNIGCMNENGREAIFKHVVEPFSAEFDSLGFENNLYRICGNDYKMDKLIRTIESISCSPDDLIFVYYAGHGLAMPDSGKTQSPMLCFGYDQSHFIPFDYIREQVSSKGCKATVMITVASNTKAVGIQSQPKEYFDSIRISNIDEGIVLPIRISQGVEHSFLTENKKEYIKNLITDLSGDFLIFSTQQGFDSVGGNTPDGSMDLFTYALIKQLEGNSDTKEQPNILRLLNDIRGIVSGITNGTQLPFYLITNAK